MTEDLVDPQQKDVYDESQKESAIPLAERLMPLRPRTEKIKYFSLEESSSTETGKITKKRAKPKITSDISIPLMRASTSKEMVSPIILRRKTEEFDDQVDTPSNSAMYVKKETERLKKLKKQKTRKRKAIYSDTDDEKSQSSDKENKKKRTRKLRKTKYEVTEEISLPEKKPFDIGNRIRDNFGKFRSKKIEETKLNIIGTELNIPMM